MRIYCAWCIAAKRLITRWLDEVASRTTYAQQHNIYTHTMRAICEMADVWMTIRYAIPHTREFVLIMLGWWWFMVIVQSIACLFLVKRKRVWLLGIKGLWSTRFFLIDLLFYYMKTERIELILTIQSNFDIRIRIRIPDHF